MKKISLNIIALSGVLFLGSCVKKADMVMDPSKSNSVIQFANTGDNLAGTTVDYPRFYTDLGSIGPDESASFNVNVNYAGGFEAPEDITVNLAVDETALETYNTQDGTDYVVPAASIFSFPSSVIIKKGTRVTQVQATIKRTADFDFGLAYALPLKIASVSTGTISGNFGTAIYSFGVRNQYDGIYSANGYVLREGDNVLSGNFKNIQRPLSTTGANSNTFAQVWSTGGAVGGIDGLTLTVDPATNKVTVTSTANPAVKNLSTYDNRYDPATKTYFVSFYWGSGPTNRAATDTLTYVGPR